MCLNIFSLLSKPKNKSDIETTDYLFRVINKQIYEFNVSEIACRCYNCGETIMFSVVFQDNSIRVCRGEIISKNEELSNIYVLSDSLSMEFIKKINIVSSS